MSYNQWSDDVNFTPLIVSSIIQISTDLEIKELELIGNGWDNIVYLVNRKFIIRLVKAKKGIVASVSENLVFDKLSPMPISIPKILFKGIYDNQWPWIIYQNIEGIPLYETAFDEEPRIDSTEKIANFLRALHGENINRFVGLRGDTFDHMNVPKRIQFAKDKISQLGRLNIISHDSKFEKLLQEADELKNAPFNSVLCHGDVKSAHLLFKDKKLSGIIDWGDVHIGHPATDLAVAFTFIPPKSRELFKKTYGNINPVIWKLAQFRAFFHTLAILEYTNEKGELNRFKDALRSLEWIFQ
jgi:aminoglycoside phosphotransferase (APT) family kinase protein